MTQEEKAKAYDKALEKARQLCAYPTTKPFISDLQDIFPELAETEDEKIRKHIIEILRDHFSGEDTDKCIAWLEKQGKQILANSAKTCKDEQKPEVDQHSLPVSDDSSLPTFDESIYHPCTEKVYEQKPWSEEDEENAYRIEDILKKQGYQTQVDWFKNLRNRVQPQLKQEWSKDDEAIWAEISDLLWEGYKQSGSKFTWDDIRNWLNPKIKSLKDRVQPKQEWTEEDKKMLGMCIDAASGYYSPEDKQSMKDWLYSLKDRYTWKPSGEQIRELGIVATGKGWFSKEILSGLLEQLKKLKE